eukprot:6182451-Pleurochrysis_carterae.AAC.1
MDPLVAATDAAKSACSTGFASANAHSQDTTDGVLQTRPACARTVAGVVNRGQRRANSFVSLLGDETTGVTANVTVLVALKSNMSRLRLQGLHSKAKRIGESTLFEAAPVSYLLVLDLERQLET